MLVGSGWTFWDAPLCMRVYLIDLMIKREGKREREKKKETNNPRIRHHRSEGETG